jgi:hypothetical protein
LKPSRSRSSVVCRNFDAKAGMWLIEASWDITVAAPASIAAP